MTPRCVVFANAADSVPVELLEGLSRRKMTVSVVSDPPAVMVELARGDTAALVLVERRRLPRVESLLAAVQRYHPRTTVWAFEREDHGPRLIKLSSHDHAASIPAADENGHNGNGRTQLDRRPAERSRDERLRKLAVQVPPGREQEPLITQEELEMLLGHSVEPAEAARRERGEAS